MANRLPHPLETHIIFSGYKKYTGGDCTGLVLPLSDETVDCNHRPKECRWSLPLLSLNLACVGFTGPLRVTLWLALRDAIRVPRFYTL